MSMKYRNKNAVTSSTTRFSAAPMSELEFSTLVDNPRLFTTLDAGDIVPVYCQEVLPHQTQSISLDFITRQTTLTVPVMGELVQDFYAFFVPNRVVNKSWVNVMGENSSGSWTAPQVSLVTLTNKTSGTTNIPIGSVADYYGIPTQQPIPNSILSQMHDLKFRGYLECYNVYFRNENYTPAIPYSKLNVYNGFMEPLGTQYNLIPSGVSASAVSDGSVGGGSYVKEVFGEGSRANSAVSSPYFSRLSSFSALDKPLKACKLHDYFTSVLPSPQKGERVALPMRGFVPLNTLDGEWSSLEYPLLMANEDLEQGYNTPLRVSDQNYVYYNREGEEAIPTDSDAIRHVNLFADLNSSGISITVDDIRMSSAMQRVYELMARGGSRYTEIVNSFFGLDTINPFDDKPTFLGHFRRDLDFYQTAQTSATPDGDGTPQGNLAAFGYTNKDGNLFTKTFLEYGYIHIFTVIRHKNVYSSFLGRDNFRLNQLDFYSYPLANISEQPVYTRQINPFYSDVEAVFGYQEAWAEYRYSPDLCTGLMRNRGASGTSSDDLSVWNYADVFDRNLGYADGAWMKSNTREVVERSTALTEREYPQFKLLINFHVKKEIPLPTYSVPGADIF